MADELEQEYGSLGVTTWELFFCLCKNAWFSNVIRIAQFLKDRA